MIDKYYSKANLSLLFKLEGGSHVLFIILNDVIAKRVAFYLMNNEKDEEAHLLFFLNCKKEKQKPLKYFLYFETVNSTELLIMNVECPNGHKIKYVSSSANTLYFLDTTKSND